MFFQKKKKTLNLEEQNFLATSLKNSYIFRKKICYTSRNELLKFLVSSPKITKTFSPNFRMAAYQAIKEIPKILG